MGAGTIKSWHAIGHCLLFSALQHVTSGRIGSSQRHIMLGTGEGPTSAWMLHATLGSESVAYCLVFFGHWPLGTANDAWAPSLHLLLPVGAEKRLSGLPAFCPVSPQ